MIFSELLHEGFILVIICSALPLAVASLAGLVVAVLQTATQIQEQSISYAVKFASVAIVLTLCATWYQESLSDFTREMLKGIAYIGRR